MDIAIKTIQDLQYRVGGNVVFLEAEDREKLLSFYENETNRFKRFDIRATVPALTENERHELIQLMRVI